MIPNCFPTRPIVSKAYSTWHWVCVAINENRTNVSFEGTAGLTTGLTKIPSSNSILVKIKVFSLSLINRGMMGVSVLPISKPNSRNPFKANCVTSHKCSIRSGSCCMISNAANAEAVADGVMLALNMYGREL